MLIFHHVTIEDAMHHLLIEDFNYSLKEAEHLAIIGEEGNGKSTLLKAIYNKTLIEEYAKLQGQIETDHKHIGYFEQQLTLEWYDELVCDYLLKDEIDEEIPWDRYNDLVHYEHLAVQLSISLDLLRGNQTMSSLSGGECVKLRLLKLLHRGMDLLLLDEPTNDLDIETLEWMEQFIQHLSIPIIFISHDETLLNHCADTLLHMEQLNKKSKARFTIYHGKYDAYVEARGLKLKKAIQIAKKEKQEYRKKKIKLNDFMNAVHDAQNDTVRAPFQAAALKTKMRNLKAQERRFDQEGYAKVDSVEEAIDVYFEMEGLHPSKLVLNFTLDELVINGRMLASNINLQIYGRDKVAITGRNGCGKSVLIKEVVKQLRHNSSLRVGYMPQNYTDEFSSNQTPVQFLLDEGDYGDVTQAGLLLGRMKFTPYEMNHSIYELSEGQKAKLYILRCIKQCCDVLVFDEPTRNLSPLSNPVIRSILQSYTGCILAVSHDRKFIDDVCEHQYVIKDKAFLKKY